MLVLVTMVGTKGVAIGAGVIGAGLGWATLNPKGKRLILKHKRNHLRAIWEEKNSNEFPTHRLVHAQRNQIHQRTAINHAQKHSKKMANFHFRRRHKRSQQIGFL